MSLNRNGLKALLAASILVLTLASSSLAANSSTAADRPDWQSGNTIQNMFENYRAWVEYTNAIDAEMEATDAPLADLLGENFSVTAELLAHYENQAYPSGSCAQDFYYLWTEAASQYMHFYGAWYYNVTSTTGEPIDTEHIVNEYAQFAEYYFNQDGISASCWAKLDA